MWIASKEKTWVCTCSWLSSRNESFQSFLACPFAFCFISLLRTDSWCHDSASLDWSIPPKPVSGEYTRWPSRDQRPDRMRQTAREIHPSCLRGSMAPQQSLDGPRRSQKTWDPFSSQTDSKCMSSLNFSSATKAIPFYLVRSSCCLLFSAAVHVLYDFLVAVLLSKVTWKGFSLENNMLSLFQLD